MKISEKYPKLSVTAEVPAEAETLDNGSVEMTADELQRIETALATGTDALNASLSEGTDALNASLSQATESLTTAQAQITQLQADLQAEQEAIQLAQNDLTQAQQRIASLEAENTRLKEDTPIPADTRTDADSVNKTKKKTRNSFDRYADEMLG
jgi:septation ring formation regulator EzrA